MKLIEVHFAFHEAIDQCIKALAYGQSDTQGIPVFVPKSTVAPDTANPTTTARTATLPKAVPFIAQHGILPYNSDIVANRAPCFSLGGGGHNMEEFRAACSG